MIDPKEIDPAVLKFFNLNKSLIKKIVSFEDKFSKEVAGPNNTVSYDDLVEQLDYLIEKEFSKVHPNFFK